MRDIIEWWTGLGTWLKVSVALIFLSISTILWFTGRFWPWGWGLGIGLLLFSFPSNARRKGYHDF